MNTKTLTKTIIKYPKKATKMKLSEVLSQANNKIGEVRVSLLNTIEKIVGTGIHTFSDQVNPYVTDEENCERLKAISISHKEVFLSDETTIDLGDIGTDDLYTLADSLQTDLSDLFE